MQIKFEGGQELEAALSQFEGVTAKAISRRALKRAADPILAAYQSNTTRLTGRLIRSEVIGTRLNKRQTALNRRESASAVEVHIGTNDPAGVQEEFGNVHQAPHPALRPAWDTEGGDAALARIGKEIALETAKSVARAQRKALRG